MYYYQLKRAILIENKEKIKKYSTYNYFIKLDLKRKNRIGKEEIQVIFFLQEFSSDKFEYSFSKNNHKKNSNLQGNNKLD